MTHIPCRVKTRKLTFEDVIGETVKQTVARTVIDLSAHHKLSAVQIIDVFVRARVLSQRIVDGKVIFEIEVEVKVLYEGDAPDQPVLVAEETVRVSDFVDIEGALPTDRLFLTVDVEDREARLVGPSPATRIAVTVVLRVKVKVVRQREKFVVVDVTGPPGIIVKRERLQLRSLVAEGSKQVIIRATEDLGELMKPPFAQLIDTLQTVRITNQRLIEGKVLFEGVVEVKVLYATPKQQVVVVSQEEMFTDVVDLPGAKPGMTVELSASVELVTVQAEDRDGDGKRETLIKTIVVRVEARVFEVIEVKVVVDVLHAPHCRFEKQLVRVEDVVGVGQTQVVLRERLDPRAECKPCPVQIIDCRAFPRLTEVRVIDNKVVVLGRVEIKVIYEAEKQTVHVVRGDFSFEGFADIPGARPGQTQVTSVRVLDVTCVLAPVDTKCPPVDVTVVLVATTRVISPRQLEVVTSVREPHFPDGLVCVVTADNVNVRSGAAVTFPVIAQVARGTQVIVLAEVGQFFKVFIPSLKIEGFIFSRFVFCEKPLG